MPELPRLYQEMKKNTPEKYIAFLEKENIMLRETVEAYREALQRVHYGEEGDDHPTLPSPGESLR